MGGLRCRFELSSLTTKLYTTTDRLTSPFLAKVLIYKSDLNAGEIKIYAEIDQWDNADAIHMRISDNGIGIEPENLERIFEQGFTTKNDNALGKSLGIGLHWSANTIIAMQGKIYAESKGRGEGACLHVLFPLIRKKL